MNQSIKSLFAVGLHGRFDIGVEFSEGINIVHGVNGTGKTTLLHILTNAANLDIERFAGLNYRSIRMEISNGRVIELSGRPSEHPGHLSDVTLLIDDQEIATWPPERNERDPELQLHLARKVYHRIATMRRDIGIDVEATYFPAFRTMIEAWSSLELSDLARHALTERRGLPSGRLGRSTSSPRRRTSSGRMPTELAREFFGQFVPPINYPSPREIEQQLDDAIQKSVNRLANEDRSLFANAFTRVFNAISQPPGSDLRDVRAADEIRTSISDQLDELQSTESEYGLPDSNSAFVELKSQLSSSGILDRDHDETTTIRILKVYEEALTQRAKLLMEAFRVIREYIDAVNDFLQGKQLVTATPDVESTPRLQIRHHDDRLSPLDTLSSGERQIAGLIYSASHVARGNVILVDEPELSLHIDWQRKIIHSMMQQFPSKQLIVCTHSPIIASDYGENMIELIPKPTEWVQDTSTTLDREDEIWPETEDFEDIP